MASIIHIYLDAVSDLCLVLKKISFVIVRSSASAK